MKSTKSTGDFARGAKAKKKEDYTLGSITENFLRNVHFGRDSNDRHLMFANGSDSYPRTISGLMRLGLRKIRWRKK